MDTVGLKSAVSFKIFFVAGSAILGKSCRQRFFEFPFAVPPCRVLEDPMPKTENIELAYVAAGNKKIIKADFYRLRLRYPRNVNAGALLPQLAAKGINGAL